LIPIVRNLPPIRVGRTQIGERRCYFLVLAGCLLNDSFPMSENWLAKSFWLRYDTGSEKNPNWAQVEAGIALLR